jgi:hypothetical protein
VSTSAGDVFFGQGYLASIELSAVRALEAHVPTSFIRREPLSALSSAPAFGIVGGPFPRKIVIALLHDKSLEFFHCEQQGFVPLLVSLHELADLFRSLHGVECLNFLDLLVDEGEHARKRQSCP